MTGIIIPSIVNNSWHKLEHISVADRLIKMKQNNQTNVWAVVDEVIKVWKERNPTVYNSFIINTERTRDSRANEYGANKREGLRYTLDIPEWVTVALRMLYTAEELDMNKRFFNEFWKRYPEFRVSERS